MKNIEKSKEQLLRELTELQKRNEELEITEIEQMQKEQVLRESEKKYSLLVESSTDMLFTVDLKGNFLFTNKAFKKCLGYSKEEMKRINGFALVHPEDMDKVKQQFAQIIAGNAVNDIEYRYKTKDGPYIHILNNAAPISDSEGNIVAALGIARDISYRKKIEEKLQVAHDELEQRVADRTAELLVSNEKLNEEIKERIRMEEALRESEAKLKIILENVRDVIFQLSLQGFIQYVSPNAESIYGYKLDQLIGRHFKKTTPMSDMPKAIKALNQVLSGKEIEHFEINQLNPKGKIIPTEINVTPVKKDGKIIAVQGVMRDITERKKAEATLRESEKKYRAIFESFHDVYFQADKEGRVVQISPSARAHAGYAPEDIIGHPVTDFYLEPEDRETFVQKLKETGAVNDYELKLKAKNGSVIETSISAHIAYGEDGEPNGVEGVLRDITERKRAEEALKESEEKHRDLIENLNEVIYSLDKNGKVTYVSPAVKSLLGYTPEEIESQAIGGMVHKDDLPGAREAIQKILSGKNQSHEYRIIAKSGKVRWILTSSRPILKDNRVTGIQGSLMDITERKKTEKELIESEKKYRDLIEKSIQGVVILQEGRIVFANRALAKIMGYTVKELLDFTPKKVKELVHPEDQELVWGRLKDRLAGKPQPPHYEYRSLRKDGNLVWLEMFASRIMFDGKPAIQGAVIDISERKHAEEALRESEEKYKTLVETSPDSVAATDMEGRIIFASPQTLKMLGYKRTQELVGKSAFDLIAPEDHERARKDSQKVIKDGFLKNIEYNMLKKDGKRLTGEFSSTLIRDLDGNPKMVIATTRDISERKKAEESLRENEERFRTMVETAPGMLMIADSKGNNIYVSPNCEKLTGYTQQELQNETKWWVHKDDTPQAKKIFKQTFQKGTGGKNYEYKAVKKNGDIWYASSTWEPLWGQKGQFLGVVMQTIDITERKKTEEELHAREAYLDHLFDSAQEAITLADSQGRVQRVNHEFSRLFGYTQEEVADKFLDDLIVPPDFKKTATSITRDVAKGGRAAFEAIRCHKDGTLIDVSVLASSIIINDKLVGTYGIYRDITERKTAEDQIKASLKEKEILLQEVHHRVKNNMQIISSLLNLQSRHITDEKSLKLFKSSQSRVKSMALIHERLYQSKDFTRVDVANYIRGLTNHLFTTYGISKEAIGLKINIKNIILGINTAIPCGLIINELVSNSLKHAFPNGKKGEIQISMRPLNGNEVELTVRDNGVGMPEDVDFNNTKSLGLYLVNILAKDQLNGEVKIDKKEGTGYHFRLKIKR